MCVFLLLLQTIEEKIEDRGFSTNYAFELFDKYRDSGEIQSNSFDLTKKMWQTLPDNLLTWIIGDAKYVDENGGYYMHVDVGYLRILFYGGLIGLFLYLLYIYNLARYTYIQSGKNNEVKLFLTIYFILVLMWMWKGHYDTNCLLLLFLYSSSLNKQLSQHKLH